jgi:phage tail P2-like protein
MNIENVEIRRLLPEFMKDDRAVQAINNVLEPEIRNLAARLPLLQTWDKLDEVSEAELDELAWEINIPWYRADYALDLKRRLVNKAISQLDILGTPAAVEAILEDIFVSASLEEWFDYDGEPHHFRVNVKDGEKLNGLSYGRLMAIIDRVKRKSQWLDSIDSTYFSTAKEYDRTTTRETIHMTLTAS